MSFQAIAAALHMVDYPALLDDYYPIPNERKAELCSIPLINRLQTELNLFGDYYPYVLAGFMDLEKEPYLKACMDAYSLYIKDSATEEARKLQCPGLTGSVGSNMLGLLMHLPSLENTYRNYRAKGFTHEEVKAFFSIYRIFLREVKEFRHGFVGFTPDVARWLTYCTKGEMFYPGVGGFYYQVISLPENEVPFLLKNRTSGEVVAVFGDGQRIHRSGIPLGSEGAVDDTDAFVTVFDETASAYWGHPVVDCKVKRNAESFPKSQWERLFSPGVDAISQHVFFEADMSPEAVAASRASALDIVRRCFPEREFKCFYCLSWLLHPAVSDVLSVESKIRGFASGFVRFPSQSGAKAVYHYVFPGAHEMPEELPEGSRLQRGLKQRILNGAYINDTAGIILLMQ